MSGPVAEVFRRRLSDSSYSGVPCVKKEAQKGGKGEGKRGGETEREGGKRSGGWQKEREEAKGRAR